MSELVDPSMIERIVGARRRARAHIARAVSDEQQVYILHSHECLDRYADLRDCPWSLALDNGITVQEWAEDVPLLVRVRDGRLVPGSQVGPVKEDGE